MLFIFSFQAIAGGFSDCRDWGIGLEGGKFKAFYDPPDSCTAAITYDQPVELNRWYYMTKISDGQTAMFYVDGNLVGSATVSRPISVLMLLSLKIKI